MQLALQSTDVAGSPVDQLELPERRRGLRIAQKRPVKVFEPALARYYGGETEDMSKAGLRIELPLSAPVNPGSILSIHVGLSDALADRRRMVPARIVWIDRRSQFPRGRLVAGLQFLATALAQVDAA